MSPAESSIIYLSSREFNSACTYQQIHSAEQQKHRPEQEAHLLLHLLSDSPPSAFRTASLLLSFKDQEQHRGEEQQHETRQQDACSASNF